MHFVPFHGTHTFDVDGFRSDAERTDVLQNGIRVFLFPDGILDSLVDLFDVYQLFFSADQVSEGFNFLKQRLNITFQERSSRQLVVPKVTDIHSGDMMAMMKMSGLEALEVWATGVSVGHMAMALWETDPSSGERTLYAIETTDNPGDAPFIPPPYGVSRRPFLTFLQEYDQFNYSLVWLPLRPDLQARFNEENAWAFFHKYYLMPYGYESYLFTQLDSRNGDVPPPLTGATLEMLLTMVEAISPNATALLVLEAINQRLVHVLGLPACTTLACVWDSVEKFNLTLSDVIAIPEQDEWIYSHRLLTPPIAGPSLVCNGLVLRLLVEGGVLPHDVGMNYGELTPRDVLMLHVFNPNWDIPSYCLTDPLLTQNWHGSGCQLMGQVLIRPAPRFNTLDPFVHMFEKCSVNFEDYSLFPTPC